MEDDDITRILQGKSLVRSKDTEQKFVQYDLDNRKSNSNQIVDILEHVRDAIDHILVKEYRGLYILKQTSTAISSKEREEYVDLRMKELDSELSIKYSRIPFNLSKCEDDFSKLKADLDTCNTKESYIRKIAKLVKQPIQVPVAWILSKRVAPSNASLHKDTRHQDTRDIERDNLEICLPQKNENKVLLQGSEIGYEGIVTELISRIEECIDSQVKKASQKVRENYRQNSLARFARVLLNAVNRTSSGGETYEAIERILRSEDISIIAPASTEATPLQISIQLGVFKTFSTMCWDHGIIAEVSTRSSYRVIDPNPDDYNLEAFAKVEGIFKQKFGYPLPIPTFESELSHDNGLNFLNRTDYEISDCFDRAGRAGYVELIIETPSSKIPSSSSSGTVEDIKSLF